MPKGISFCIGMLLTLSLFAQNEGSTFVIPDSSVCKRTGNFRRIMKKFLNFSDFDTTYISPNRYNYALMLDHFTNYEYYSVGSATPDPQRLRFSPKPHNKIGVYFGWRWIFWVGPLTQTAFTERKREKRGTEFDLSLYSSKLGVDIIYRRTGNSYKIHDVQVFRPHTHRLL